MPSPTAQRIAIIDLGSNSARLVVMNSQPGYTYHLEDEIREIVRLREGMTEAGLSADAIERGLQTLRLFKRFCDSYGVDSVIATATSAVREAPNGSAFLQRVRNEIDLDVRLLSGEEEALYGVLGALNAVPLEDGIIVDIGGGSAQVSQVRGRRFVQGEALTLGALALTVRFVHSDPIKKSERRAVQAEIERQLDTLDWLSGERGPLVGLGGTIRTLAKIDAARQRCSLENINGYELESSSLDVIIEQLCAQPLAQRRRIPGMVRDRADILLPGALVIRAIMERLGTNSPMISAFGLREGLFFEQFWRDLPYPVTPDLRTFSVLNLARFYGFQEKHARHVCFLARRLFDQLAPLHQLGVEERELLAAAALLHDIGLAVRYNDHHKHSQALIASNGLPGFTPREIALIALAARYHRKGTPAIEEYAAHLQNGDEQRLAWLAALLRLAEYLERGRACLVRDIRVSIKPEKIACTLVAEEHPAVEMWDAERNALDLLSRVAGRPVVIETWRLP